MLDIGFSELLLIAVVGLIFIGPKDLPVVVRHIAKFVHEIRGLYTGIKGQMHTMMEEAGLNDLKRDMTTTIIDMDGKPQEAYDVATLEELAAKPPEKPKADA